MDRPEDIMQSADQSSPSKELSVVEEADRRLAEASVDNRKGKTQPRDELAGRCITNRPRYRSRSPNAHHKLAFNKHLSVADELDRLSEDDTAPEDWTADPSNDMPETPCEGQEVLEDVDLNAFETQKNSTVAEPAMIGFASDQYKPKRPSRLAFEIAQEDDASNPVARREAECQEEDTVFESLEAGSASDKGEIEEKTPRRSRLDDWLEGVHEEKARPSWEVPLEEPKSQTLENKTALAVIPEHDEELDSSVTDVQLNSRETSQSTRVASNDAGSKPQAIFEDYYWSDSIDFGKEVDLQSLRGLVHVHDTQCIANEKPLAPLVQSPLSMKSAELEGNDLREFMESAICRVDAIRSNRKDKYAPSKVKDIQHLVKKVLINEMCGERKSLSDMLDGSAWCT